MSRESTPSISPIYSPQSESLSEDSNHEEDSNITDDDESLISAADNVDARLNETRDVIKDLEELTGENEKFKKSTKTNKKKSVIHPEPSNENTLWYKSPSADFVECSLQAYGIPGVRYDKPYFSNLNDKPDRLVTFQSHTLQHVPKWPRKRRNRKKKKRKLLTGLLSEGLVGELDPAPESRFICLQTIARPPTRDQVEDWLRVRSALKKINEKKEKEKERVKHKILIRADENDSEGSEMFCSPVSLPGSPIFHEPTTSRPGSPEPGTSGSLISQPTIQNKDSNIFDDQLKGGSPTLNSPTSSGGSSPIPPSPQPESPRKTPSPKSKQSFRSRLRRSKRNSRTTILEESFMDTKDPPVLTEPQALDVLANVLDEEETDLDLILPSQISSQPTPTKDSPSLPGIIRLCQEDSYTRVQQTPPSVIITKSKSILKRRISDDMFEGSPEVTEDLSDTPLLKQSQGKRLMARIKLKRRISWQLPQQENDPTTLGDDIENNDDSNCMLVDDDITQADCDTYINPAQNNDRTQTSEISTSNETLSNESMTNKSLSDDSVIPHSILEKLNDTELIKRYLTPKQKKDSASYVEGHVSVSSPAPLLDLQKAAKAARNDHLSMLVIEVLAQSRPPLYPDPLVDPVEGIFYSIVREDSTKYGCIIVSPGKQDLLARTGITGWRVRYVESEDLLFKNVVRLVRDVDPDILAGYEIQLDSWGFLFQRSFHLGFNMCPLVSRIPDSVKDSKMTEDPETPGAQYQADHTSEIILVGRIIFNSWRLLRSELALYSYTLQNVCQAVLGKRIPHISPGILYKAWKSHRTRYQAAEHMLMRLEIHNDIMAKLDLLSRTSELARLFGIQFYEVISRGSQFRVESSMLRLAKPRNYVPVSPTRQQLAAQAAPEYLALLLEPESRLYTDPVIVLDFQSLYPSIIIGYNYCYSTCLGRIDKMGEPGIYQFGCTQLQISPERLEVLKDYVTISPGGIVFLKPEIRRGVLPQMLEDILNTRIMVKQSMKKHAKDPDLQKILHSRQLGLKLIANVTYGYTSANFSGRMPCIEVGDSVVSKAREALEQTIRVIESRPDWGGKVVYGDTDSVFVLLKGKSKDEAFDIGEDIAKVITEMNPKPMKLKFEKVYLPCILQTKKRYVGYMYESKNQEKPVFDAKGIETVRRDGIPATAKILEKSIRILFETKDISQVKSYVQSQFMKLVSGSLSIQDLTFAKEFRGMQGYRPTACVPALEMTKIRIRKDRRRIPRTGERVPYVIVYGEPGLNLIQLVREPLEVLYNQELRPNAHYYITKVIIPPLNRCLLLVGVDALNWYSELPRVVKPIRDLSNKRRGVISKYFISQSCKACGKFSMHLLCDSCESRKDKTANKIATKLHNMETNIEACIVECVGCAGPRGRECISLDCSQFYRRVNALRNQDEIRSLSKLLEDL